MKEGDPIWVTDGQGSLIKAVLTRPDARKCSFEPLNIQASTQEAPAIHIAISPTKQMDRMEWFVEKATEIGIHAITIIRSDHSERSKINIERLRKTSISAMKQSLRTWLPVIDGVAKFSEIIKQAHEKLKVIAELTSESRPLEQVVPDSTVICLIGPEGGFSSDEIEVATNAGFVPVLLNAHRLRTETAGLVACQILHRAI